MERYLAALLLLVICGPAAAEELRWKLKPDDQFLAKVEQKSEVQSSISGASPTTMTLETGLELSWRVTAVDDSGVASITQKFQRLRMKLEMPKSGAISYDSASETKPTGDAKAIAAALQPLLEAEVTLSLTPRGEIKSVQLDEATSKALEGLEANSPLKSVLSKDGLSNLLRQTVVVLPEKEVKPGEEWSRETPLTTPLGSLKQSTKLKLLEPDAKSPAVARIESTSNLELDTATNTKPRPITLKHQHQKGVVLFDTAAGHLRSAEVEQELVTTSSLKDTPIQVKLVSSLTMTLEAK